MTYFYNLVKIKKVTPDTNPDRTPTPPNTKRALGLVAGAITAAALYGVESSISFVMFEGTRNLFQSTDKFESTVGILVVLGIMFMLIHNSGEFPRAVLSSGIKAGKAVYNTIQNS
ncbi:hypothetical protein A2702_00785 [Candidatus Amesbacteria bacterium RIFCSPHIGHO2_01_FULL_48_75]|nr:MAG: hypothetical protein A2702_00785 [Candidatus Amesbacteria bacterium RIFCSPHIGHO2_01_FULL_48_75]